MKIIQDFKAFAMKGSVIDLAVAVIIGAAFGKIVSSLVDNILMPFIGLLIGGVNFTDLKIPLKAAVVNSSGVTTTPEVAINYGDFLQATFDFLIIAITIFLFIRLISNLSVKKEATVPTPPPVAPTQEPIQAVTNTTSPEVIELLTQIRDLLGEEKPEEKKPRTKSPNPTK